MNHSSAAVFLAVLLAQAALIHGQSLLDATPELDTNRYYGAGFSRTLVAGPNASYPQAVRIHVAVAAAKYWDMGANHSVLQALADGEPLRFVFWGRNIGAQPGQIVFKLQKIGQDDSGYVQRTVDLSETGWREYNITFNAPQNLALDPGARVALFFGGLPQTIEIAGLRLERRCLPLELNIPNEEGGAAEISTLTDPAKGCFERVAVTRKPTNPWGVQLTQRWTDPIRVGDWIEGTLTVRRTLGSSITSQVTLVFQETWGSWTPRFWKTWFVETDDWRELRFRFKATTEFNSATAGAGQFAVNLGDLVQSVDITGFMLRNAGVSPTLAIPLLDEFAPWSLHTGDVETSAVCDSSLGVPFLRARTVRQTDNPWEVQMQHTWAGRIERGDVLAGSLRVRSSPSSGTNAALKLHLQHQNWTSIDSDPYRKVASFGLAVDHSEWRTVSFAFRADEALNYSTNTPAQWAFDLGYGPQSIDLADLVIQNLGPSADLASLPNDFMHYPGRDLLAPWRQAAEERIERTRKADYVLKVADQNGNPLAGIPVRARLWKHYFAFGGAIKATDLVGTNANPLMQSVVTNWFNRVVFENDLKWGPWPSGQTTTLQALAWLEARAIPVRGHTLIWPVTNSAAEGFADAATLLAGLNQHVLDEAGAAQLRGRLLEWDVVNEPTYYNYHVPQYRDLYQSPGFVAALTNWFRLAREADPSARRFINEFGILEEPGGNPGRKAQLKTWIRSLRAADPALLEGIGLQAHLAGHCLMPPERLLSTLDEFAGEFGLPIAITELDIDVDDPSLQADYTRDLLMAAFSHPAVTGVMLWIWWPGSGWHGRASLFNPDWSPKPNGLTYSNLVLRTWQTDVAGKTDSSGRFSLRGFKGTYDVTVDIYGHVITNRVSLLEGGDVDMQVTVPAPLPVRLPLPQIVGNQLRLAFKGEPGRRYQLQTADTVTAPRWIDLTKVIANPAGSVVFSIIIESGSTAGFYRVVSVP